MRPALYARNGAPFTHLPWPQFRRECPDNPYDRLRVQLTDDLRNGEIIAFGAPEDAWPLASSS
jgi:hypothetical protein